MITLPVSYWGNGPKPRQRQRTRLLRVRFTALNARNNIELDAFARSPKFTVQPQGYYAKREDWGASKTSNNKNGNGWQTVDQDFWGTWKIRCGWQVDNQGRAAGSFKGQIDRQAASGIKSMSLDGAEVYKASIRCRTGYWGHGDLLKLKGDVAPNRVAEVVAAGTWL